MPQQSSKWQRGTDAAAIVTASWGKDLEAFRNVRAKYLLYR